MIRTADDVRGLDEHRSLAEGQAKRHRTEAWMSDAKSVSRRCGALGRAPRNAKDLRWVLVERSSRKIRIVETCMNNAIYHMFQVQHMLHHRDVWKMTSATPRKGF